jgi:hypothetical protein
MRTSSPALPASYLLTPPLYLALLPLLWDQQYERGCYREEQQHHKQELAQLQHSPDRHNLYHHQPPLSLCRPPPPPPLSHCRPPPPPPLSLCRPPPPPPLSLCPLLRDLPGSAWRMVAGCGSCTRGVVVSRSCTSSANYHQLLTSPSHLPAWTSTCQQEAEST